MKTVIMITCELLLLMLNITALALMNFRNK